MPLYNGTHVAGLGDQGSAIPSPRGKQQGFRLSKVEPTDTATFDAPLKRNRAILRQQRTWSQEIVWLMIL